MVSQPTALLFRVPGTTPDENVNTFSVFILEPQRSLHFREIGIYKVLLYKFTGNSPYTKYYSVM